MDVFLVRQSFAKIPQNKNPRYLLLPRKFFTDFLIKLRKFNQL